MVKLPDIPPLPPGSTITAITIEAELGKEPANELQDGRPVLTISIPLEVPAELAREFLEGLLKVARK